MHIIEQSVIGKYPDSALCEDGLFISEHFVAIVDGATSKGKLRWSGHTAGRHACTILLQALAGLPADIAGEAAITRLNQSLTAAGELFHQELARSHVERLMASIVIYSAVRRQVWSFGDCQYCINQNYYKEEKKTDTLLSEVRSFALEAELAAGRTLADLQSRDVGRELIMPFLELQSQFANRGEDWRFAVLDGFAIDLRDVHAVDVPPGSEVILASDGYPELEPTLAASEAALEAVRREDPLCMSRFKSTKGFVAGQLSFDDRAYVRFIAP